VRMAIRIDEVADACSAGTARETDGRREDAEVSAPAPRLPEFHRVHEMNRSYLGISDTGGTTFEPAVGTVTGQASSAANASTNFDGDSFSEGAPADDKIGDDPAGIVEPAEEEEGDSRLPDGSTSLVIDGGDVDGLIRDRAPVVYSEDGQVVFKGWEIPYHSRLMDAVSAVGKDSLPLVVEPIGVKSANSGSSPHVVVSTGDARRIVESNRENGFLEKGDVSIVIKQ